MHPQFLDYLMCPKTGQALTLEATETDRHGSVISGTLTSSGGVRYPILRAIPRFVDAEGYSASFGYEWTRWPRIQFEAENVGRPMQGHTTKMWEKITGVDDTRVAGKTIVEFGCGPGRFLDVVRRKQGRAVGLDLSLAVEAARQNFAEDPDVLIVQGDVLNPPFRPGAFEAGYSIGVFHHTPDPAKGVSALARVVGPGGWVACCVYPREGFYAFRSVARFRALHKVLSKKFGYRPALAYSQLAGYIIEPLARYPSRIPLVKQVLWYVKQNWLVWLDIPDARWRVLDVFDAITPGIASTHTEAEVHAWLTKAGCQDVHTTGWGTTSAAAVRH